MHDKNVNLCTVSIYGFTAPLKKHSLCLCFATILTLPSPSKACQAYRPLFTAETVPGMPRGLCGQLELPVVLQVTSPGRRKCDLDIFSEANVDAAIF